MKLRYVTYKEIDKRKWDKCIHDSINGLIYAESIYLDHMAANWDAIILNDYDAVMPLTWKSKWGIRYLYQPAFIQQGGIFFKNKLEDSVIEYFIEIALEKFRFAECTLNYLNLIDWKNADLKISLRNNFILRLGKGYEHIAKAYNTYIRQRISRLKKFQLQYQTDTDHSANIRLYKKLYGSRMKYLLKKDLIQFEKLCTEYSKEDRIINRQVLDTDGKTILASVLLLKDERRVYNIISNITAKGKKLLANYFMYNELIREFAEKDILFDFEGSDIPGVAYFYEKFSSANQQYAFLKFNKLPMPVKLLKR